MCLSNASRAQEMRAMLSSARGKMCQNSSPVITAERVWGTFSVLSASVDVSRFVRAIPLI